MACIRSVAIMLSLQITISVGEKGAVCKYDSNQAEYAEGCSPMLLQVDSKRQEYAVVMSQQQRAEVNGAMFELHATLHAHPKVAKQALHEVLLGMADKSKGGHETVMAQRSHEAQVPPMGRGQLQQQTLLLKERLMQPNSTVAPGENDPGTEVSDEKKEAPNVAETPPTPATEGAKIAPFGKEDTATELTMHAERTQDTLVDAVENAEVAEVKRAVFRALTRLRAASIKEFDTIARLETQAIDEYNDAHHYRVENPLNYIHSNEPKVKEDKYTSFH
jgi:hypothetical protein